MSLIELQRELKILKKKIIKEKLKLERRHRKEINQIITPLEEKIYVTKLRIKAFQNNSNKIFSTKNIKDYTTIPQNKKRRQASGFYVEKKKKPAQVKGSFQILKASPYKPRPINRQAAKATGFFLKGKK